MFDEKRYGLIFRHLVEKKQLKTREVMEICGTSRETARKDLERMQEYGVCTRVHGGAVLTESDAVTVWKSRYCIQKDAGLPDLNGIAAQAAKLIQPGSCIYLEAGNTMACLAQYIKNIPDLTVLTPNPAVLVELAGSQAKLVFMGGELSCLRLPSFVVKNLTPLETHKPDISFMSCGGIDLRSGTVMEYDEYGLSREFLRKVSKKMVLVCNSEKVNRKSFINACPVTYFDYVVVDDGIRKQDKELLSGMGVQVVIA